MKIEIKHRKASDISRGRFPIKKQKPVQNYLIELIQENPLQRAPTVKYAGVTSIGGQEQKDKKTGY